MYIALHVVPHVLYGVHAQHLHVTRPAMHCTEYKGHYYKSTFSTAQYVTLLGKAHVPACISLHMKLQYLQKREKYLAEIPNCTHVTIQLLRGSPEVYYL